MEHQNSFFRLMILFTIFLLSCNQKDRGDLKSVEDDSFKVVGYYVLGRQMPVASIPYQYLTTINLMYTNPSSDGSGDLTPPKGGDRSSDTLHALVENGHKNGVEIFATIGGFGIGDGPGIDTRFEVLANSDKSRKKFAHSCMNLIREFDLDGIDMDWEFPDPEEPSLSNFVFLMKELADSLHPAGKKLTAAVESHRLPYTYGIDERIFDIVDWLNIMVYDGEEVGWHRPNPVTSHAPYWLAEESLNYWVNKRGLPRNKAILGLPFYGKGANRRTAGYRNLLAMGADPFSDVFDSLHYNGIKTVKRKVRLAKEKAGGIMIFQIASDTTGKFSLLKAINDGISEE